jgi:putative nucleotidyltransferase with HDIG domain
MSSAEPHAARSPGQRRSPEDAARALAWVLREEFGVSFAFYDAATGTRVPTAEGPAGADRPQEMAGLDRLAATGRAQVTPLAGDRYLLTLVLHQSGRPAFVAVGSMAALARGPQEAERERSRLEKWAQAFSDRLRLAGAREDRPAAPVSTLPWEVLLSLAELARHVRLHRNPDGTARRILKTAASFLGAQLLAWVPRDPDAPAHLEGNACLTAVDCRQLTALLDPGRRPNDPVLCDAFAERDPVGQFPQVRTVLALPVHDQGLLGWVLAVNKEAGTPAAVVPFRKSDAALLTPFAALLEMHARGSARYLELKDLLVGLTRALTSAIDAKDSYTFGHSERVARIAVELGRDLGLDNDALGDLYLAGLLHDIGKIGVRDEVLRKPGKLTPQEEDHIRQHVTIGYSILSDLRQIRSLLPGVLYHHERYDGAGYPDGLAGEDIPQLARILAVADGYDAMTTARPYRDPLPWSTVENILAQGAGTQWDARVVAAFMRCRHKIHTIRQRGVGESLRAALDGALRYGDHSLGSASLPTGPEAVTPA